jgi:carbon-monoxide dehydrogenase large subunit
VTETVTDTGLDQTTDAAPATQAAAGTGREVGNARRRKEDQRLITGRTKWTDNITLPGMLHVAMVRSPFAHAKILSVDTSAAGSSS